MSVRQFASSLYQFGHLVLVMLLLYVLDTHDQLMFLLLIFTVVLTHKNQRPSACSQALFIIIAEWRKKISGSFYGFNSELNTTVEVQVLIVQNLKLNDVLCQ